MGRKLEFSKDKALLQAMEGFWSKGYDATSMRDLAQRLNLHLGSVYNALGDKEQVFEAALRLHLDHYITPFLAQMQGHADSAQGLRVYIDAFVASCRDGAETPGCFFINSLLHINTINARISSAVRDYLQMTEDALAATIARAQKDGGVDGGHEPRRLARFVFANCKSMHAMKKIGVNDDYIDDIRLCLEGTLFKKAA
jgi:TetR/AcrR family transcriptional repressor of nem operon